MAELHNENEKKLLLGARALQLRIDSIRATTASKSGHPTTCLSAADIISVLFFDSMKFDVRNPYAPTNDRFILSKGHGVPVVYAAYKQLGVISDEELMALREFSSPLEGHPTPRFIYNEAATGSLGQGLAIGAGMALHAKSEKLSYKTYVLLGDGEIAEGSVWEAAEVAAHYKLSNLIGFIDCNRLGQTGETMFGHEIHQFAKKFEAFGWNTTTVDGHSITEILEAIETAKQSEMKPTMIIAKTYKGHGVDLVADKNGYHGKPFTQEDVEQAVQTLQNRFAQEYEYVSKENLCAAKVDYKTNITKKTFSKITVDLLKDKNTSLFKRSETIATRKAFGYALAALGLESNDIIAIDADVKNSTYTDIFEKEFPDRMVECFIAEQTMVGVATGLQIRGKIPFAATFGAFFTRAHDQIRMAGIGRNALRLSGSHCGVSIGPDGPSQMALEDLGMMRSIPGSVVLYPSDGVSTYKLTEKMANYHDGISYLRTTRSATPVLYDQDEEFEIGGCKVLRQSHNDKVCLIAAGITLHEALKAHDHLRAQGVLVSVIDAYSIKPLDVETIKGVAQRSGNKIITIEDHYQEGGLGEAVAAAFAKEEITVEMMAVKNISRSGSPQDLLAYAGIDAKHIVKKVME